jgi:ribA/ribD-fused uncharacterized protein
MSTIEIRKVSITDLDTDAIVNAANDGLWAGGGVCGAIFKAAGYEQLQAACNKIGHCDTGSAVITPGFNLKAKYIIHAVGPRWKDGKHKEPEQLYGVYYKSLELAAANGCRSIGFPLISAGIFGYPVQGAWYQAFDACGDFLDKHKDVPMDIVFAVLNDENIEVGHKALLGSGASRYKIADRNDWTRLDMPEQHDIFIFQRPFTAQQMAALRRGNIPQEMEDKWFWFMEGDTLFAHRSWTGVCIYQIDFKPDNKHVVTVNRDPEQYKCTSTAEDAQQLNNLLNWWTQDSYDYYHEWLAETVDTLKKAGKIPDKLKVSGQEVDAYFFHRPEEPHGYLSNWYTSPFDLDGMHFSSVEQYIMYRKCMIFGDETSAKAVLATEDTAAQQAIGRKAAGYIGSVWAGMRQMVVLRGLMAKFSQNEDLKQKLLDTGDAYLVECAGSDKIWACGIRLNDDKRFDASNWTGDNILGFALMEVREMLREAAQ